MTIIDTDPPAEGLRAWAKGLYPLEAATELLIRGGYAQTWRPWVHRTESQNGRWWIDFAIIPIEATAMSGGERRFLRIAASLGSPEAPAVVLEDAVSGLDREKVELVLAAIAHAAGTHEGSRITYDAESGRATGFEKIAESLHPWPEES